MAQNKNITHQLNNASVPVQIKRTKRGMTLYAYNFTQRRYVGTGSVNGAVYEKGNAAILRVVNGKYDPSFALTVAELQKARDLGATFLRCITPEPKTTYAISLSDFVKHAQPYTNSFYGQQLACSVEHFAKTGKTQKRNPIIDNPRTDPKSTQPGLFPPSIRRDQQGNVWKA